MGLQDVQVVARRFTIGTEVLDAPSFGNYFAGHVTSAAFGDFGLAAAIVGGELNNMGEYLYGRMFGGGEPTFFDPIRDQRLILQGGLGAQRQYNMLPYTLTCPVCVGANP